MSHASTVVTHRYTALLNDDLEGKFQAHYNNNPDYKRTNAITYLKCQFQHQQLSSKMSQF